MNPLQFLLQTIVGQSLTAFLAAVVAGIAGYNVFSALWPACAVGAHCHQGFTVLGWHIGSADDLATLAGLVAGVLTFIGERLGLVEPAA